MIRNFFYSIFLHLLLCLTALFFFWQHQKEQKKEPKISVTSVVFMQKKSNNQQIIPENPEKPAEKPPEIRPEPKPEPIPEPKPEPKKPKPTPEAKKPEKKPKPETKTIKKDTAKSLKTPVLPKVPPIIENIIEAKKPEEKPKETIAETVSPPAPIVAKKIEPAPENIAKPQDSLGVINLQVTQQDIEKQLNSTLSKRETFNIQAQFRACYQRALAESNQKPMAPIIVKINLNKDGYIITNLDNIIDKVQYQQNKNYQNSIDNVKKMIEFCNPIVNLAKEKYSIWQEIVLQLNENNNL